MHFPYHKVLYSYSKCREVILLILETYFCNYRLLCNWQKASASLVWVSGLEMGVGVTRKCDSPSILWLLCFLHVNTSPPLSLLPCLSSLGDGTYHLSCPFRDIPYHPSCFSLISLPCFLSLFIQINLLLLKVLLFNPLFVLDTFSPFIFTPFLFYLIHFYFFNNHLNFQWLLMLFC